MNRQVSMAGDRVYRAGEVVRWNRRVARIQRITADKVHIKVLKDVAFRVVEHEIIPRDHAEFMLVKIPQGHYSTILFDDPEKIEKMRDSDASSLMKLVLLEHECPFGKREFKQVLVSDDGLVPAEKWNSFWCAAYKAMRACPGFSVDCKGRYGLA